MREQIITVTEKERFKLVICKVNEKYIVSNIDLYNSDRNFDYPYKFDNEQQAIDLAQDFDSFYEDGYTQGTNDMR
jgi:hypothetical protein